MQDPENFLTLQLRIDWSEMDTYQHVNNLNFLKYMQSARVQFWEVSGLSALYSNTNKGPILASTHCDFKHPLFYPGTVLIKTYVSFIKTTSFGLSHQLYNDDGVVCAKGDDVAVCFDFTANQKFSIPEDIRQRMHSYSVKSA